MIFRKPKTVVGLDIGSSAVKAVQLKQRGKTCRVSAFASEPVSANAIVDGAIIDAEAVVGSIRRLFGHSHAFKTSEVCASLSGNTVIVRKITLPVMTETELHDSICWEAEQYIPFDIHDVNLDYQVLDPGTGPEARGSMEVLLVAAKRGRIDAYTSVISRAGRNPVVVDVDAFALQNAYEANYGFEAGRIVALLNAGASSINLNIVHGDRSVFTRDISVGGNAYTEAVQKELGLSFEDAEKLKRGIPIGGATFADAEPVMRAVTDNVLLEIHKTIEFFTATAGVDHLDLVVLSGGVSRLEGLKDMLAERVHAPVEFFDPFRTVKWDAARLGGVDPATVASTAAVAVGLALRQTGDR